MEVLAIVIKMTNRVILLSAVLAAGTLSGCGGSSSTPVLNGNLQTTGGLTTNAGTGTPGISSGSTPQQVQVTVNGATVTGILPPNETIPASGQVNVISPAIPILVGLTLAPKSDIHKGQPVGHNGPPTVSNGGQGEVDVDGCNTGLTIDSQGALSGYLVLVPGTHNITAIGPFAIIGGGTQNPLQLSVGRFVFNVTINPDGVGSIPSTLQVNLPINGGVFNRGHFVKATFPTPDFSSGTGGLTLQWTGVTIAKTQRIVNGN